MHLEDGSWSGDATAVDFNGDGWPDLYVLNMQGGQPLLREPGRQVFVDKTAEHFPKTPWGAMGVKVLDYDNDGRPDMVITDMHSDMSHIIRRRQGEAEVRDHLVGRLPAGRCQQHLRQRALPQPRRRQVRGGLGRDERGGLLALGRERRRPQRRRLSGPLHHRQHELPLPLRHQLPAAQRPGQDLPRCRVHPRRRAAARRPDPLPHDGHGLRRRGQGGARPARVTRARSRS